MSRRDSGRVRARGEGGGSLPSPFRSAQWTRTASAEEKAVETKGWHGDGPLDSISKCFTDEHAFVVSESNICVSAILTMFCIFF